MEGIIIYFFYGFEIISVFIIFTSLLPPGSNTSSTHIQGRDKDERTGREIIMYKIELKE